jgi:hypothetical protein
VRPKSFSTVPRASGPVDKFYAPEHVFGGVECVRSSFHVLRARTRFRQYRGRRVLFSCFARSDSFSTVPRASGPVVKFCAPGLVFMFCAPVVKFRRCLGRQVSFSCFAHPNSFLTVPRASGLIFMSCAPELDFGGNERVGSRFHVLRSWTRFWRYRGRRVPFSCFMRPDSFSAVSSAPGPFFMFYAPGIIFGGTEGVRSRCHVLRARTHFRR